MGRVRGGQAKRIECRKVLIAILFKSSRYWLKHENLPLLHQLAIAQLYLSNSLIRFLLMETLLNFSSTPITCGEHRKFEAFLSYCLGVSGLDKMLYSTKETFL